MAFPAPFLWRSCGKILNFNLWHPLSERRPAFSLAVFLCPLVLLEYVLRQPEPHVVTADARPGFSRRQLRLLVHLFQIVVDSLGLLHEKVVQIPLLGYLTLPIELSLREVVINVEVAASDPLPCRLVKKSRSFRVFWSIQFS